MLGEEQEEDAEKDDDDDDEDDDEREGEEEKSGDLRKGAAKAASEADLGGREGRCKGKGAANVEGGGDSIISKPSFILGLNDPGYCASGRNTRRLTISSSQAGETILISLRF